jgi:hypothetical protein
VTAAIYLYNHQGNNFCEEYQQNAKWSGLACYVCSFPAFSVGGPTKGVHCMPSGFREQCPQSSSSSKLLVEKSGLGGCDIETVTKVGVAYRHQMDNISPCGCPNPL